MRRLTHGGIDSAPVWSPDGRQIAFQRAHRGGSASLYVANADGSGERLLPDGVSGTVDWSPDGRQLLFVRRRPDLRHERGLERPRAAASTRSRSAPPTPRWSPDGSADRVRARRATTGGGRLRDERRRDRPPAPHPAAARTRASRTRRSGRPTGGGSRSCCRAASDVMNADGSEPKVLTRFPDGIFPSVAGLVARRPHDRLRAPEARPRPARERALRRRTRRRRGAPPDARDRQQPVVVARRPPDRVPAPDGLPHLRDHADGPRRQQPGEPHPRRLVGLGARLAAERRLGAGPASGLGEARLRRRDGLGRHGSGGGAAQQTRAGDDGGEGCDLEQTTHTRRK